MVIALWEWGVVQEARSNPVGVCRTRDGAKAALAGALLAAGQPARGNVREMVLVASPHLEPGYKRFPIYLTAVYEQGTVRWERSSWKDRRPVSPCVPGGGPLLCAV